jgi:hypothetical protein
VRDGPKQRVADMTVEEDVKQQFARVFEKSDWKLFKGIAESYLQQAARLRKKDLHGIPRELRLLARNCQKRLFIGIAVELLLKATYLHQGFCVNKPADMKNSSLKLPFTPAQQRSSGESLSGDESFTLGKIIDHVSEVVMLGADEAVVLEGLNTAKVYRNKEGHIVAPEPDYVPSDYRKIESALTLLYRHAFKETLELHFSVAPNERPVFRVSPISQG